MVQQLLQASNIWPFHMTVEQGLFRQQSAGRHTNQLAGAGRVLESRKRLQTHKQRIAITDLRLVTMAHVDMQCCDSNGYMCTYLRRARVREAPQEIIRKHMVQATRVLGAERALAVATQRSMGKLPVGP